MSQNPNSQIIEAARAQIAALQKQIIAAQQCEMRTLTCLSCPTTFQTRRTDRRYCSTPCRHHHRRQIEAQKILDARQLRPCSVCGKPFLSPHTRAFCREVECIEARRVKRCEARRAAYAPKPRKAAAVRPQKAPRAPRACRYCPTMFVPKNITQICCKARECERQRSKENSARMYLAEHPKREKVPREKVPKVPRVQKPKPPKIKLQPTPKPTPPRIEPGDVLAKSRMAPKRVDLPRPSFYVSSGYSREGEKAVVLKGRIFVKRLAREEFWGGA